MYCLAKPPISRAMRVHIPPYSIRLELRAPPAVSPTRPPAGIFLSGWRYSAQPCSRFLVFPWDRPLIHPESPGHPRPPGVHSRTPDERKAGTARSVGGRTREPHFLIANPPFLLVALSPPAPPLANPPAGCLHSAVPPPTSLYSTVCRVICLYSVVGKLLASCLIDTPGRYSSICLGGHGLGQQGGADIHRAF
jgi:hypothetical protein